jgi:plastocyanin
MRQRRTIGTPAMVVAAFIAAVSLASMAGMVAYAMARGDRGVGNWGGMGMGSGHMQQMMGGGGVDTSNATPSVGTKVATVDMQNFAFSPGNLHVPVGATVTFTNHDAAPHSATARDGSWDTGLLNNGESKTITFDKPGDYEYYCTVHPNMVARLTVQ